MVVCVSVMLLPQDAAVMESNGWMEGGERRRNCVGYTGNWRLNWLLELQPVSSQTDRSLEPDSLLPLV